jgi:hypothetical protein
MNIVLDIRKEMLPPSFERIAGRTVQINDKPWIRKGPVVSACCIFNTGEIYLSKLAAQLPMRLKKALVLHEEGHLKLHSFTPEPVSAEELIRQEIEADNYACDRCDSEDVLESYMVVLESAPLPRSDRNKRVTAAIVRNLEKRIEGR